MCLSDGIIYVIIRALGPFFVHAKATDSYISQVLKIKLSKVLYLFCYQPQFDSTLSSILR